MVTLDKRHFFLLVLCLVLFGLLTATFFIKIVRAEVYYCQYTSYETNVKGLGDTLKPVCVKTGDTYLLEKEVPVMPSNCSVEVSP